jgi:transposase InsO family protein
MRSPWSSPKPLSDGIGAAFGRIGAPRIHGELLMLGIEVAQSTVARYMTGRQGPPSQGWKTFLRNHAAGIASIDLFVVRTISFKLLYGLVILRHARRRLVNISVTNNPTAEWIAGQVTDAFPWDGAPRHLIRDRDVAFGPGYTRRIHTMGIRDHPTAPRSPWQNGHIERAHRIDTSRISRPPHRVRRGALARCPEGLRFVLQ